MEVGGEFAEAVEDTEDTEDLTQSPPAILVSQGPCEAAQETGGDVTCKGGEL